jgi:hypothetical protein
LIFHSKKLIMKKIKRIVLFAVALGFVFSCEDATDIVQPGEFNENVAFQSVEDMNLVLTEVYDRVSIENEIAFTSLYTDEVAIGPENGGQNIDDLGFNLFPTSGYSFSMWYGHYNMINLANRLIDGSSLVEVVPGSADEAEKNDILAQARVLRAFGHFQLLTYFSTDMKNDNALGVMLLTEVPDVNDYQPRVTNGEVFAAINQDLDFAEAGNLGTPTSYKFVSEGMIKAFRARMAAYRGRYAEAGTYAGEAIALAPGLASGVPAATSAYRQMWQDLVQGEIIWALDRPAGKGAVAGNWFFNSTDLTGGPFLDMGRNLYAALTEFPSDVRDNIFVDATSTFSPDPATDPAYRETDVIIINKYWGKPGAPLTNDLKVFRTSEMYFILAESQVAAGDLTAAAATLQTVRNARRTFETQPTYSTATVAYEDILSERRKELCFEGHRWIDLKRLGAAAGIANAPLDRYFRDCEFNGACQLPLSDHRWTMPIPVEELNANPLIRGQQNPGY